MDGKDEEEGVDSFRQNQEKYIEIIDTISNSAGRGKWQKRAMTLDSNPSPLTKILSYDHRIFTFHLGGHRTQKLTARPFDLCDLWLSKELFFKTMTPPVVIEFLLGTLVLQAVGIC
jgi:hypothetical protein